MHALMTIWRKSSVAAAMSGLFPCFDEPVVASAPTLCRRGCSTGAYDYAALPPTCTKTRQTRVLHGSAESTAVPVPSRPGPALKLNPTLWHYLSAGASSA
jgi:hypothetical protein